MDPRSRTRSEYRREGVEPPPAVTPPAGLRIRRIDAGDRDRAAAVLLDGYRGTVDDEGEDEDDAAAAIDHSLRVLVPAHSVVAEDSAGGIVGLCFVVTVHDLPYVDPIVTAAAHKRRGIGRALVVDALRSLRAPVVGAVITDGNEASEALFRSLGFSRVGPWG